MGFFEAYFRGLFRVFLSDEFRAAVEILYALFPFWGPPLLAMGFFSVWVQYIRAKFIAKQKYVLLEIRLPREVFKSPFTMELALAGFFQTGGEATWYDKYYMGKSRPWFSFEIVSIHGAIHFYVWTRAALRNVVETHFYAQYPDIEIFEVPDYTERIPHFDPEKVNTWGHEYKLDKPDPFPIKTYIDYGLDQDPKEEFKVDPLTSVLEYMATMNKDEELWVQILFQAHKMKPRPKTFFGKMTWQEEGKEVVKKLRKELLAREVTKGEDGVTYERIPTKSEQEMFAAIERNLGKLGFDCGIRVHYATRPGKFDSTRIIQTIQLFRPYSSPELNSFSMGWGTGFPIDWIYDPFGWRRTYRRKKIIKAYRFRSYFHGPYKRKPFILSSEELATIFHLPGGVLQTPAVSRVMSKKADAPSNLPV